MSDAVPIVYADLVVQGEVVLDPGIRVVEVQSVTERSHPVVRLLLVCDGAILGDDAFQDSETILPQLCSEVCVRSSLNRR